MPPLPGKTPFAMTRNKIMPAPKKTVSEIAIAVSIGIFVRAEIALAKSAESVPVATAPTMSPSMLRPFASNTTTATRKTVRAPGRAEWARASPTRLRRGSTASAPSTPAAIPRTAAPSTTTDSV